MLTVGEVLERLKDEYADATDQVVPAPSLARHLSDYQQTLMGKAFKIDDTFKAQQVSIAFDLVDANDPAVVGRGTSGGLPIVIDANGNYVVLRTRSGNLIEYNFDKAARLVNERAVLTSTANAVQTAGVVWVFGAYVGKLVRIVSGKGAGTAPRLIAFSFDDTVQSAQNWEVQPDLTSTFEIIEVSPDVTESFGVATSSDPTSERTGYLVREDANGVSYIDYTKPLRATFATGIPLPPHHKVLGGDVRYAPVSGQTPAASQLSLNQYGGRAQDRGLPEAYVMNGELFLAGSQRYWKTAASIDLRIVPIPPDVFLDTDAFLLDQAKSVLIARAVLFAHQRARALKVESADVATAATLFSAEEGNFLDALSGRRPAKAFKRRDSFTKRWN